MRWIRAVASRSRASIVLAFINLKEEWVCGIDYVCRWCTYFGIGITKFNSDVSHKFVFESNRLYSRDRFHDGRFSVSYVTDGTCKKDKKNTVNIKDRTYLSLSLPVGSKISQNENLTGTEVSRLF